MNRIKYSHENAILLNKLVTISDEKLITNLKIRQEYIEFQIVDNDLFRPSNYLDENDLFKWFSIVEQLDN